MALSQYVGWSICAVVLIVATYGGVLGGTQNAYMIATSIISQGALLIVLKLGWLDTVLEKPALQEVLSSPVEIEAADGKAYTNGGGERKRLLYVENVKTFLASGVCLAHAGLSFCNVGWIYNIQTPPSPSSFNFRSSFIGNALLAWFELGQSYAMVLFFFIAGYFVPSSFAKKGAKEFLIEKLMRLGVPLMAWVWIIQPLLIVAIELLVLGRVEHPYFPMPLHLWFALWLLLFFEGYALVNLEGKSIKMDLPNIWVLICGGFVLGGLEAFLVLSVANSNILGMPIGSGCLPFDIVSFCFGCIAKNNHWLESFANRQIGWQIFFLTVLCCSFNFLAFEMHGGDIFRDYLSLPAVKSGGLPALLKAVALGCLAGCETVIICLAALRLFANFFDFQTGFSKMLAGASYTVYLVHPLVVVPVTMFVLWVTEAFKNVEAHSTVTSTLPFFYIDIVSYVNVDAATLKIGWACAFLAVLPLTFSLAIGMSKIPCLKGIL